MVKVFRIVVDITIVESRVEVSRSCNGLLVGRFSEVSVDEVETVDLATVFVDLYSSVVLLKMATRDESGDVDSPIASKVVCIVVNSETEEPRVAVKKTFNGVVVGNFPEVSLDELGEVVVRSGEVVTDVVTETCAGSC